MMDKVIALYCEMGKKESAVLFVKEVLRRSFVGVLDSSKFKDSRVFFWIT
jgi:hypothetical protein